MVPLSLMLNEQNIWTNQSPSSSLLCRPIRLQYIKETPDILRSEKAYFHDQIDNIKQINLEVNGMNFSLNLKMQITMLDGKAINALTNTRSTQSCNVCGAKPNEMSQVKPANDSSCAYGISGYHFWIRFFEFILHVGYKLAIKKFVAKTPEEKQLVQERKSSIQHSFKNLLSLNVDMPKVGSGNSNDGNTARRAFVNSELFSNITGVDKERINRLHAILQVINCKTHIDCSKFKHHCEETVNLAQNHCPWYKLPDIIIGYYSEEAQESMNKIVRNARLSHSRKTSRLNTMQDQMKYLLLRSDPLICSKRKIIKSKSHELTREARDLLMDDI